MQLGWNDGAMGYLKSTNKSDKLTGVTVGEAEGGVSKRKLRRGAG